MSPQKWLVMKLITVFLIAFSLQLTARSYSQTVNLSVKATSLAKVFSAIEKQTGYVFFYDGSLLREAKPVTVNLSRIDLEAALKQIFLDQPLTYSIKEKTINVFKKNIVIQKSEAVPVQESQSPILDVRGVVKDEAGKPVEGVAVQVKGTSKGTTTNINGEFNLQGIDDNSILFFSHVNLQSFEVKVGGKTELTINLKAKISELADVAVGVVNTGYQSIGKERFVGAVSKLDSAAYNRRAGLTVLDRLDGIIPGMVFNRKSAQAPIQIRGISTLGVRNGASLPAFNPLIIVDNFPYEGDLNLLNQNDILDIEILKDAAAASIWGTRAGNGVIVITTKKGKFNQVQHVSVSSNVIIQDKADLYYYPQMSSSDYIDIEQLLFGKGFYTAALNNPKANVITPVIDLLNKKQKGLISATDADNMINALRQNDVRQDYNKYIYRSQVTQQYFANIGSGSNVFNYNLSIGYNRNASNIQNVSPGDQFTISSFTALRPLKNLELELGVNISKTDNVLTQFNNPITIGAGKALYPYAALADGQGNHLAIPKDYAAGYADTAGAGKLLDWRYRPLDEVLSADNTSKILLARINFGISYKVTDWLKAEMRYQYMDQVTDTRNLQGPQTYFTRNLVNLYTNLNQTNAKLRNPIPVGGILDISNGQSYSQNLRAQISVNKTWNRDNRLTGMIASDVYELYGNGSANRFYGYNSDIGTYATGLDYSTIFNFYGAAGSNPVPQGNALSQSATNRFVSLLANASYTYQDKYTLYASARRDGANVFGVNTNNKWKPLWSIGGSWEISKESFLRAGWLPYLRLRTSYGFMGNVDNTRATLSSITYQNPLPFTGLINAGVTAPPNPDLKWEEVRTLNVGLDFGLFKRRITGSLDVYQKKSYNVISPIPFDITTGISSYTINSADLKGNGFELQLHSLNIDRKIKWETSLSLGYNKTIVTKYYGGGFRASQFLSYGINPTEGQIAWGISSYKWAGLDPLTGDPQGFYKKAISKDYISIANDSLQNQVFNGSALPLYSGNFLNTISYKNLSLSFNITYKLAYYFRRAALNYNDVLNGGVANVEYLQRWQKPGDEKTTNVPSLIYPINTNRESFYQYSEINVLKGDNIRWQDARLSYTVNNSRNNKMPFKSVQLFLYVNNINLIIWRANRSDLDPDYTFSNSYMVPPSKSWTIGMNINL
jgi:TonB-linked SusC/RagA family outer membrane protein